MESAGRRRGVKPMDEALAIFFAAYNGTEVQNLLSGLPQQIRGEGGELITVPGYFGSAQFVSLLGGSVMPYPEVQAGGQAYKMTFYHNAGVHGWSESLRWYVKDTTKPYEKLFSLAKLIAKDLLQYRSVSTRLVAIRITEDKKRGGSRVRKEADDGVGIGSETGALDQVSNALIIRGADATEAARELLYFHGFNTGFLRQTEDVQNGVVDPTPKMQGFRDKLKARLLTPYTSFEGSAVCVIKTYQRDPALNPEAEVSTFTVDANGFLKITLAGDPYGTLAAGTTLAVHASRERKFPTGISGRTKVITDALVDGNRVYTLSKRPPCIPAAMTGMTGTVQQLGPRYVKVTDVVINGQGDHQVGRPFGVTPGRRSSR